MDYSTIVTLISRILEVVGIAIIVIGSLFASIHALLYLDHDKSLHTAYRELKQNIARSILLGLEFFIAGDIIQSVSLSPSFTTVGVLAVVVLIRTFLSWELTMEIDGKLPWQRRAS
jgi:uncharacterized membrane protein